MKKKNLPNLDDMLRPMEMGCIKCGGRMTVYPCPFPEGTACCPTCSPKWVESFAQHLLKAEREKRGLLALS